MPRLMVSLTSRSWKCKLRLNRKPTIHLIRRDGLRKRVTAGQRLLGLARDLAAIRRLSNDRMCKLTKSNHGAFLVARPPACGRMWERAVHRLRAVDTLPARPRGP